MTCVCVYTAYQYNISRIDHTRSRIPNLFRSGVGEMWEMEIVVDRVFRVHNRSKNTENALRTSRPIRFRRDTFGSYKRRTTNRALKRAR